MLGPTRGPVHQLQDLLKGVLHQKEPPLPRDGVLGGLFDVRRPSKVWSCLSHSKPGDEQWFLWRQKGGVYDCHGGALTIDSTPICLTSCYSPLNILNVRELSSPSKATSFDVRLFRHRGIITTKSFGFSLE